MISENMKEYVKNSSIIRGMFEEGKRLASIYGAENVYDFSIGNPNVEPPKKVKESIIDLLEKEDPIQIHGYMNNSGYEEVRAVIAASENRKYGTDVGEENIIMTVGAAGGLNVILKTLLNPGEEVVVFAPFFGEYRNYVSNFGGKLTVISPITTDFSLNFKELEEKITSKTKAVIINNPNNPTGVVYSEEIVQQLSDILQKKEQEYGISIYLISDEPYRELVYDGVTVPYITKYYHNAIIGYSYSKSLSLPGERIGFLLIPNTVDDFDDVIAAANVATRILGFVNAPSLMQKVIAQCVDEEIDVEIYNRNRELLYNNLMNYGFSCIKPQGAFYLFVKTLEEDDVAFCQKAKQYNLLIVPGSSFGCPGYCRIAYCVDYNMILRSLSSFEKLAKEYK